MRLVGIAEIAKLLGVKPATPSQWLRRGLLPEPYTHLAIGPVWRESDVIRWAQKTGRLKGATP